MNTEEARVSYKGRINQYTCEVCGGVITTIDRDDGTTPMILNCRATPGCPGTSISSMYRVDQTLTPDHEWYKPARLPRNRNLRDHVERGGLLIRPIDADGKPRPAPNPAPRKIKGINTDRTRKIIRRR